MNILNDVTKENCVGKVLKSCNYGDFKVLSYNTTTNVEVEFVATNFRNSFQFGKIRAGKIKDPFYPYVCGVGFIGNTYETVDKSNSNKRHLRHYECWIDMVKRAYSIKKQDKHESYKGCEVSENFKSYTYFYEWCEKQIGFVEKELNGKSWHLDKDILVKGNKIYSEDTCVFVPNEINCLFTKTNKLRGKYPIGVHFCSNKKRFVVQVNRNNPDGSQDYLGMYDCPIEAFGVYKKAKEAFIKEVAEKWKGRIDGRVYHALMNYEVEITD